MITEYDLFDGYGNDENRPTIMCGSGNNYTAGCGAIVANNYKGRQNHVEFHNRIQELLDRP